ncbi:hypothetical protein [Candidatus Viadribacter manganicus]|uniref:Lipoprotein n=1 Tax=Candidatus Viadribacter manganicus TaxID=1759059 RepID=A0A1B1AJI0_9PROT|nr:hypothetical protein [Candidatus Viadribacter manganicus]ANP46726.1 hypothetical protein ATE48_12775 [Candidatus Viadribacter manganicus]
MRSLKLLTFMLVFALSACATAGSPDTIENSYGNTLVATLASGAQARYYFNPDGTYSVVLPSGVVVSGVFEVDGDQICRTPAGGTRACAHYVDGKSVGDTWTQTASDGSTYSVTLRAGREP